MNEQVTRKLAAIFYADVAGYSRLTGLDEVGTHRTLSEYLDAITGLIRAHDGRVLHFAGDAILAEFPSVVVAATCAIEVQQDLASRNAEFADDRKLQFRIGINLGDVIVDREELYGDGVNVAARLETIAEPGGICVSASVRDQIMGKVDAQFQDMGLQQMKNIAQPVRAYRIVLKQEVIKPEPVEEMESTSAARVPEKPSIAVLPFDNMSADPEQEFFVDGITEDIITALSKISGLFVIARNSTFGYKGVSRDIRQVASELGVRYVLEGSVRKGGSKVRITAELVDSTDGSNVWAARFDRDLDDVFAVQDEITSNVVTALHVRLVEGEQARVWRKSTQEIGAWECLTQGLTQYRRYTKEGNNRARTLFERALELDPEYAAAWVWLGWTYWAEVRFLWTDNAEEAIAKAAELAEMAAERDDTQPWGKALKSAVHLVRREFDEAVEEGERAVALDPNGADLTALLAMTLNWAGRPEESLTLINKAIQLSPRYSAWYLAVKAHSLRLLGRNEDAISIYKESLARNPDNIGPHLGLTAAYAETGRDSEANLQAQELLRINPGFSLKQYENALTYRQPEHAERSIESLRRAGLPD